MAEFTGITAARAEEILGQSVISGVINTSGHLILSRADGSEIDAGDFTGIVTGILDTQVTEAIEENLPNVVAGTVVDKGDISGAMTFAEFNNENLVNALIKCRLTGNVSIDAAALPAGAKANTQFAIRFWQDDTGGRTLSLVSFKKSQGVLTLTVTPGALDIVVFLFDGSNWYAGLMGADFK